MFAVGMMMSGDLENDPEDDKLSVDEALPMNKKNFWGYNKGRPGTLETEAPNVINPKAQLLALEATTMLCKDITNHVSTDVIEHSYKALREKLKGYGPNSDMLIQMFNDTPNRNNPAYTIARFIHEAGASAPVTDDTQEKFGLYTETLEVVEQLTGLSMLHAHITGEPPDFEHVTGEDPVFNTSEPNFLKSKAAMDVLLTQSMEELVGQLRAGHMTSKDFFKDGMPTQALEDFCTNHKYFVAGGMQQYVQELFAHEMARNTPVTNMRKNEIQPAADRVGFTLVHENDAVRLIFADKAQEKYPQWQALAQAYNMKNPTQPPVLFTREQSADHIYIAHGDPERLRELSAHMNAGLIKMLDAPTQSLPQQTANAQEPPRSR